MHKFLIVFCFMIVCSITSCKRKSNQPIVDVLFTDYTKIKISPSEEDKLLLSDIAKSIKIIELDSSEDALIGEIKEIAYDQNIYFCQDVMTCLIFCFDTNGKFLNKIGRKGQGPGEMVYPGAFALNKQKKEVWQFDNNEKINKYTYTGDFKESVDINCIFMSSFNIHNNTLFCYTAKATNWKNDGTQDYWCNELTIIRNDDEIKRYFSVNTELYPIENRITVPEPTPFSDLDDSFTFHYTLNDMIFSIDKESAKVDGKYFVDFGEKSFKQNISQMKTDEFMQYMNKHPQEAGFISNIIETDSFLHFRYRHEGKINRAIYNKESKNIIYGESINDVFTTPIILLGQRGGKFIGCIDNVSLLNLTDKAPHFLSTEEFEQLKRIDFDSNIILVEFELNNF